MLSTDSDFHAHAADTIETFIAIIFFVTFINFNGALKFSQRRSLGDNWAKLGWEFGGRKAKKFKEKPG